MLQSISRLYINAYSGLPRKVWYLSLIMLINRSGAMVIPFLTVYLTAERGYDAATAAWIMVAFGAGGVVGNYVGGLLNDWFGSWHIQFYSLISSGLLFIALGQTDNYWLFCILIFLLSVAADAFRPANRAAVAIYTPKERLTQAFGLQRMAVNLGFSIGPLAGGIILTTMSYEALFWIDGVTCVLSGIAFLWLIPRDETAVPLRDSLSPPIPVLKASGKVASSAAHLQPWLLITCLSNVLVSMCFFQLFSVTPVYLEQIGYTPLYIGYIFTFSGIVIVLFEMPLLYLTEPRYSSLSMLVVGSAIVGLSYCLLPAAVSIGFGAILAFSVLLTIGEMLYMPFGATFVTENAPLERRGEYLGLLSASFSLAFILAPAIGLNIGERYSMSAATFTLAAFGLAGTVLLFTLRTRRKRLLAS